jgi:putative membrane-bound dehydrogenase-like protein
MQKHTSIVLVAFLAPVLQAEDVTHRYVVPEGLAVTKVAESPLLYNPTAIDIDPDGRIWVAEAVNYRQWNGRNPGRHHDEGDRIVVLEDLDGDGLHETSHVFAQDEELVAPLGIAVLGNSVIVSCSPHLYAYHDDDGDLKADRRETLLTGFGGFNHDHGVHSVVPGPDGRWYLAAGNAGPHVIEGPDGSRIDSGSIYNGGGPENAGNTPGRISGDGRKWTGGIMISFEPDGSDLRVHSHNFRNQYELALDAFGNMYTEDNDDDGNRGCRTTWVMEGGNYGFFSEDGTRSWQADRRPGQNTWTAHWHQDDPGVMPAGTQNGGGGPTGVAVYEGKRLSPWIDGAVLDCDAGAGVVYIHRPTIDGAGIDLPQSVLIAADPGEHGDRARWFRPSDVAVGPDGAVYVADWYDPGVGGHGAGDREAYGRILRIDAADPAAAPEAPVHPLVSPAPSVRWTAIEAIDADGVEALPDLEMLFFGDDPRARARAAWMLARIEPDGRDLLRESLLDEDPGLRLVAYRALRAAGVPIVPMARMVARDSDPALRREVAISLRDAPWSEIDDIVIELARRLDGNDRVAVEAFGIACDGKEAEAYSALAQAFGGLPANWDDRFAAIAWRLHPEGSLDGLAGRSMDRLLSRSQRRSAVDAIAFIPTEAAAKTMVEIARSGPDDVRGLASWWVDMRSGNAWAGYKLPGGFFGEGDLEGATRAWSSGVVSKGVHSFEVDVTDADQVVLLVDPAGGDAFDWADWLEVRFRDEGTGEWKLVEMDWMREATGWGSLNRGRNAGGAPLRSGGRDFTEGVGVHAPSSIMVEVPKGATTLVGFGGVDEGGSGQSGSSTRLEFQVWTRAASKSVDFGPLKARLADQSLDLGERTAAVREIARDGNGGFVLLTMKREGDLPKAVEPITAEVLRAHPDVTVRAAALEAWPPVTSGRFLRPIEEIVAMVDPNDVVKTSVGRLLYEAKGLCAQCHAFRGAGGAIGPDLSEIARKYDARGLIDSMINPNAAISFGYELTTIETTDGGSFTGTVIADGPVVVVQDAQGVRTSIPAAKVASRCSTGKSPMPSALATGLDARELAQVTSYLLSEDQRRPVFAETINLFNGRNLDGWTAYFQDGSRDPAKAFSVEDGILKDTGRPIGYLKTTASYTSFELVVEWRFDPKKGAGNSGVLMRLQGEDKIWPNSIEAQLWSTNAGDIWNIDDYSMTTDPVRTNGRHTVKAHPSNEKPLGEWNRYRILLDGENLTLEVNGLVQNEAIDCAVLPGPIALQAEGAWIEFRKVELRPIIGHE